MSRDPHHLRLYLTQPMLGDVRKGRVNFVQRLIGLLDRQGWQIEILPANDQTRAEAPDQPGFALCHMEKPTHSRALTFRRAYHFPFWRIEPIAERWRWPVALARFDPSTIDGDQAARFHHKLAARVLPGPAPRRSGFVLIPLQGRIGEVRSFQTMSPLDMVEQVAKTGRAAVVTLHPNAQISAEDRAALEGLAARHPNLSIGGDTGSLLRDCDFVATQNSAVAFDGYILGKPAVLFAQVDFHHIALNVAQMGAEAALAAAPDHRPDFSRYLIWFLDRHSINMSSPDAATQIALALQRCGWPVHKPPPS